MQGKSGEDGDSCVACGEVRSDSTPREIFGGTPSISGTAWSELYSPAELQAAHEADSQGAMVASEVAQAAGILDVQWLPFPVHARDIGGLGRMVRSKADDLSLRTLLKRRRGLKSARERKASQAGRNVGPTLCSTPYAFPGNGGNCAVFFHVVTFSDKQYPYKPPDGVMRRKGSR